MATIAEKSRTKEVIERLQSVLNNASPVPLAAGKVTVYKDEMQSLLEELSMLMDAELKTYHEVNDRRGKIINEAKKEAERIIHQAERTASRMRVTKRSTNVSPLDYDALSDEDLYALSNADEIYGASLIYTDEMLTEVSKVIEDAYHNIRNDYEIVMQVLEDKMHTITSNKDELMSGLQEMDGEDRSQQILEIGQLLSQELYNERLKQRVNSDKYDDGSVQLTLDLQLEQAEENARQAEEVARQTTEALEQMTAERNALMETVMEMERAQVKKQPLAQEQSESENMSQVEPKTQQFVKEAVYEETAEDEEEYEIVYVTEDELEEGEEYEIEYVDEEEYEAYEAARIGKTVAKEEAEPDNLENTVEKEEAKPDNLEKAVVKEEAKPDDLEKAVVKEEAKPDNLEKAVAKEEAKPDNLEKTVVKEEAKPVNSEKEKDIAAQQEPTDSKSQTEIKKEIDEKKSDMSVEPHFKSSEKIASAPSEQIAKMAKAVTTEKKYSGLIGRAVANREKAEAAVSVEETEEMPIRSQRSKKRGPVVPRSEQTSVKSDYANNSESVDLNQLAKSDKPENQATKSVKSETETTKSDKPKTETVKPEDKAAKPEKNTAASSNSKTNKGRKRKNAVAKSKPDEKKDKDIKIDAQGNQYVEATMQYDDPYEITEF
jgi:hypothetical protein